MIITIIKWLLILLIALALIGGAVDFQSSDEDWSLVVNKEAAFNSIQNGSIRIYDFFTEALSSSDIPSSANTPSSADSQ